MTRLGLLACGLLAAAAALLAPSPSAPAGAQGAGGERAGTADEREQLELGRDLYLTQCSSCHGAAGAGGPRGPSLFEAGEAGAFYYVSTGRMPLSNDEEQPRRKPPAFDEEGIAAVVAYVASLGDGAGPELPDIDSHAGDVDLARGGELYRDNCQPCHSAAGAGGALSYGRAAPQLAPASPIEAAAAMRFGPGEMPAFRGAVLDDDEVADIAHYVDYLDNPEDPGGIPLGRTGPVAEGFVAWFVGMVGLLGAVAWIGTRT